MFNPFRKRAPSHKKPWWRKHIKVLALLGLSGFFILGGITAIWFSTLQIPDLGSFEARKVAQSTKIFDRTGEILLYDVHSDARRTVVPFEQISKYIKDATVAIEDDRFYEHKGIVPMAILRAVFANLTGLGLNQGGSTITQQVIKNSVLTKDKTLTRKLKEWVLAVKLERVLPKDQIFETYLNENPYGGNMYGVEVASQTFFGKSAKDVSIAEAAYIAAIPQAPTFYSPYGKNKDRLDVRQRLVLSKMKEFGYIKEAEYKAALKEKVTFLERNTTGLRAPHFAMYVRDYLQQKYGEDMVDEGGLKVITTLDYTLQEKAEKVVKRFAPTLENQFAASNTAMVAINPKNGDILVMVGSRDYFDTKIDGNFNVATALRQPGSTFKPFVYATAFMEGYTPDTVLFDVKTEFSSQCNPDGTPKPGVDQKKCYSPVEYDGKWEGPQSIREALAHSRNIPAVKALYLAGIKDSITTAQSMGITSLTDPDRYGLTLVLGGGEVSLLELTSAYGVFANDGVRNPHRAILRVEDSDGKVLEESHDYPNQAIPAEAARQINDVLSDTKVRMASLIPIGESMGYDKPVALKTGTTNDYRDVWIEGYTPTIAVGAWAGRNDNTPMSHNLSGLVISPLWGAFMTEIAEYVPKEYFKKPEPTPQDIKPVLRGNWRGGVSYFIDTVSKKVATPSTPLELRQEVTVPSVHNILHWVNKEDPRGPVPSNPQSDSQYANWEYGVRNWFEGWKMQNPGFIESPFSTIPTATDDVHTSANAPRVSITSPAPNSSFSLSSPVTINIGITSSFGQRKSDLYVNERYIYTNDSSPTSLSFIPRNIGLTPGNHTVRVVAYDTALNRGEATLSITITE